uniref:Secreted protein n=1 Tax=Macaca fascicularis TaxID=9541 RepID=A0A7N9D2N0_MACFA
MCWMLDLSLLNIYSYVMCVCACLCTKKNSGIHVQNVQVCYIGSLCPCLCPEWLNSSFTLPSSFTSL